MEKFKSGFPADLTQDYSPSIPKDFPKDRIPSLLQFILIENLCEVELMKLLQCFQIFGAAMQCQTEYKGFLDCKQERDLRLFQSIQQWEIDHYKGLTQANQQFYRMGLGRKQDRLEKEVLAMPDSFVYQNKKQRCKADVEQLQWRIRYLSKILKP